METHLDSRCSIADVASAVGVSRRVLEHGFMQCVGLSPARYWRTLRLNNVRRLLETGRSTVTEAAFASGFHHLGRMAAGYREHFGELPSETMDRSAIA